MSIIVAARYNKGILLASDPFYFDNDGEVPLKGINFNKFIVSVQYRCAMVGVGSAWVLEQAAKWIAAERFPSDHFLPALTAKWKQLNHEWKKDREREIAESKVQTLRPLSDSIFFLAKSDDLSTMHIGDSEGKLHSTSSFVLSGSGSGLVRHLLESTGQKFSPNDSLEKCLDLTRRCYCAASYDLYVIGFPSIVLVTEKGIRNFTEKCAALWSNAQNKYFSDLTSIALKLTD